MHNALNIEPNSIARADVQLNGPESLETNLPLEGPDIQQATSGFGGNAFQDTPREEKEQAGKPTTPKLAPPQFRTESNGSISQLVKQTYVKICGPIDVVAQTRDQNGENWGLLLEWNDSDGNRHQWAVPRDMLVQPGTKVAEQLAGGGLQVVPGKSTSVKRFIDGQRPKLRIRSVPKPGWYTLHNAGHDRRVFVLPNLTVGSAGEERVVLQTREYAPIKATVSGTLATWQREVACPSSGNSRIVLAICTAFAGALLEPLGKESGGFHMNAVSSTGKTTTLHVASSVWGLPLESWRTTDNGLETTAERHNHMLLCLDELSQLDPRKLVDAMYMLANGLGKQRSDVSGNLQSQKHWLILFLSTGELSPSDQAEIARRNTTGGVEVRVVNLDADAGCGMGIFETIHGATSPAEFADRLKAVSNLHRGTAGPAFVEYFIENEAEARADIDSYRKAFLEENLPKFSSGEIPRVVDRFALVAAAGELATKAGITGWLPGEASDAAAKCSVSWLSKRTVASSDMEKAIEQIRNILQMHVRNRFYTCHEGSFPESQGAITNPLGYLEGDGDKGHFLVFPKAFKDELCKGFDYKKVAKELQGRTLLVTPAKGGRNTMQRRIPGPTPSYFYVIAESIVGDGDEEDDAADEPGPA